MIRDDHGGSVSKKQLNCIVSGFGKDQVSKLQVGEGQSVMVKRALLCFEGEHQGMYGPVKVSAEMLQLMADRFNREFANPKNENDYPPLIKDHNACADNVLGRLIAPLSVEEFQNPRTGETVAGLFGNIRVDCEDAQVNVLKGKYAHLSISFDDDVDNLGEIYEVSFVGVEAARGAMVLKHNKGVGMSLEQMQAKLSATEGKIKALQKRRKSTGIALKAAVASLKANLESASTDSKKAKEQLSGQIKTLKTTVVKAQFAGLVRKGKLSKAEMDKINFEDIAAMEPASQKVLFTSYESRPASADAFQHGSESAEPMGKKQAKQLTGAAMRKRILAQKSGKKLSQEDKEEMGDYMDPEMENAEGVDPDEMPAVTMEDMEDAMGKLAGLASFMERIDEVVENLKSTLTALEGEASEHDKDEEE